MARKKPFRQLSKPAQRRIEREAVKRGWLTSSGRPDVRRVRASTAASQAARGHGAATPSRAGGLGESAARRAAEAARIQATGEGMTSAQRQEIRRKFEEIVSRRDRGSHDGTSPRAAALAFIEQLRAAGSSKDDAEEMLDFLDRDLHQLWEEVRDGELADYAVSTFQRDELDQAIAHYFDDKYGTNFSGSEQRFFTYTSGKRPLRRAA